MNKTFDYALPDSQATSVQPVSVHNFDFAAYEDYEAALLEKCQHFWAADSGVLVYRRMRVRDVFAGGCRDKQKSLEWQLGALKSSMDFQADVPNFLEPWFGIGTAAAAFGYEYVWPENQAPAIKAHLASVEQALNIAHKSIAETNIGRQTLEMIDYFLENTHGRLPLSFCDVQSPFNAAGNFIDINAFLLDVILNPSAVVELLNLVADLIIDFTHMQQTQIGDSLVFPGHGFPSCRAFSGFGMSDDNIVMISGDQYQKIAMPSAQKVGDVFGGPCFHSCGNWSNTIDTVKTFANLRMVDGAFSEETDPSPNPPEPFAEKFSQTPIVLNARMVGGFDVIQETVKKLWRPGLKLVLTTYCQTPDEQARAYDFIHSYCQ